MQRSVIRPRVTNPRPCRKEHARAQRNVNASRAPARQTRILSDQVWYKNKHSYSHTLTPTPTQSQPYTRRYTNIQYAAIRASVLQYNSNRPFMVFFKPTLMCRALEERVAPEKRGGGGTQLSRISSCRTTHRA